MLHLIALLIAVWLGVCLVCLTLGLLARCLFLVAWALAYPLLLVAEFRSARRVKRKQDAVEPSTGTN